MTSCPAARRAPGASTARGSWAVGDFHGARRRRMTPAAYALYGNCGQCPTQLLRSGVEPAATRRFLGHGRELGLRRACRHAHHARRDLAVRRRLRTGADDPSSRRRQRVRAVFARTRAPADRRTSSARAAIRAHGLPCESVHVRQRPGFSDASQVVHAGRADELQDRVVLRRRPRRAASRATRTTERGDRHDFKIFGTRGDRQRHRPPRASRSAGRCISPGWRKPATRSPIDASDSTGIRAVRLDIGGRVTAATRRRATTT